MSLASLIDSSRIQPKGGNILAVQYRRPAKVGILHLPESYDTDGTWNWWEVVKAGPDCSKILGMPLKAGDIIRTPWRPGIDTGYEDEVTNRRLFFVPCQVEVAGRDGKMVKELNVTGIIPKTWEE